MLSFSSNKDIIYSHSDNRDEGKCIIVLRLSRGKDVFEKHVTS